MEKVVLYNLTVHIIVSAAYTADQTEQRAEALELIRVEYFSKCELKIHLHSGAYIIFSEVFPLN